MKRMHFIDSDVPNSKWSKISKFNESLPSIDCCLLFTLHTFHFIYLLFAQSVVNEMFGVYSGVLYVRVLTCFGIIEIQDRFAFHVNDPGVVWLSLSG